MKNRINLASLKTILILISVFFVLINVVLFWNFTSKNKQLQIEDKIVFQSKKNILVLNSYTSSFDTYPKLVEGLNSKLGDYNISIDIENMDTKRLNDDSNIVNFYNSLKYKLDNLEHYDIIIASDDNALKFALTHRDELFKDKPLLFLGVNNLELANTAIKEPNVMGIAESISIKGTLDIATKLYPEARTINFITDNTSSGRANLLIYSNTREYFKEYNHRVLNLGYISFEELASELRLLDDDDIVIVASSYLDRIGTRKTTMASSELMSSNCSIPIFALFDFQLNFSGFIGGQVASHYDMGAYIGDITLKILSDQSLIEYQKLESSHNLYIFDYTMMNDYGLDFDILPNETTFVNKPVSFFDQYRKFILSGIIIIVFQLLIIGVLTFNIQYRKKLESKLIEENFTDELTKINNRRKLINDFDNEKIKGKSYIYIDLDNFKLINDIYGHGFGDYVLKELAKRMSDIPNSTSYRIAGDEYVIVIDDYDTFKNLEKHIEAISKPISNKELGIIYSLSISVGALEKVDNLSTLDDISTYADNALYEAKKSYKKIIYVDDKLKNLYIKTVDLQKHLIDSVNKEEILPYFQPIISLSDGTVSGFEVLARWNYQGEIVPAFKFMNNAVKLKVITDIDRSIVKKTNEFFNSHLNRRKCFFCINISANSLNSLLQDDCKWNEIFNTVSESKMDTIFEISETVKISSDINDVIENLLSLYGFKYAIDDYGSGESNLNFVNSQVFSVVKTDISILPSSKIDAERYDLFNKFVAFLHSIGKIIVVEGVETKEQLEIAIEAKVHYAQGYYLSHPLNSEDALAVLNKRFEV